MTNRPQSSGIRRFFSSRLFLIVILIITALVAFSYARVYYQDYKVRQEIESLKKRVNALDTKKIESMKILEYVMSKQFVEEKARTELNLKEPGEKVLIINDLVENNLEETNQDEGGNAPLSNIAKWWYYFTNKTKINY